jgi:hypothetical protein
MLGTFVMPVPRTKLAAVPLIVTLLIAPETQRTSVPRRSRLPAGQMAAREGARRMGERAEWIRLKRLFA